MSTAPPHAIKARERKDLDPSLYSSVDAFLKPLKASTRRLQVASTVLANEEQLLQRIYYKGKNQHRSALFWRRAVELRRYSERARKLNLGELVHRLRCSFFGEAAVTNQNLMKGAWTHCLDTKALDGSIVQCLEAQAFFTKFESRCVDAYSSFSKNMQTGAFIQILLVLAAISARLRSIAQEYQEILVTLLESLRKLKVSLAAPVSTLSKSISEPASQEKIATATKSQHPKNSPSEPFSLTPEITMAEATSSKNSGAPAAAMSEASVSRQDTMDRVVSKAPAVTTKPTAKPPASSSTRKVDTSSKEQKRPGKEKPSKKRSKRDAIDDIFGF